MSLQRTLKYIQQGGFSKYWRDMQYIGDAKWGRMVGIDSNGNMYWENNDEQPGRTRWVDYKFHDYDSTQLDPIWHAWLSHTRCEPPSTDPVASHFERPWQSPAFENFTGTRGAYRPYNTTKPKFYAWEPKMAARQA
ncbi:hypothetical protein MEQU1_003497 [Malassezia equina]|uniref:NADH dehydrogenase [ubiquinone] 1 alpha subcomplex subunit n=1 Tax=Malassezia equina TaxID=1381935 RepID=A0AAF0EEF6_9BASI|nr:hypothetical protein MEQU1_003497 [Malassezia equina]